MYTYCVVVRRISSDSKAQDLRTILFVIHLHHWWWLGLRGSNILAFKLEQEGLQVNIRTQWVPLVPRFEAVVRG